ncbi:MULTISPECIES: amidohydrolase [Paenibacillus]|uniref:amidohydrolase family protein n=1 Tax=Paenibacillus TaxID=44249 RepID=UPI000B81CF56|nr:MULTISPECIES: amidohydrolase family protein [Paenibacillus]PRA07202.1 amidohydrolase [Paenibacillus sp. MYb63]PRA50848.1 amidohydrolase [Paenibacillus sp. MYb67]QZN73982.1 amidohydrolase family protein [Paenibacillus sp. DR312]
MKLDAHQHFWEYNVAEYGWIGEEMKTIRQSFLPQDLEPLLVQSGLVGCIAVQARQSLTETEWLLQLADRHECIKGVVGWVDLCSNEVRNQLELFASNPYLKGVRHVIQDEPDLDYVLREDFQRGISLLKEYDLAYDLLVSKEQLPYAVELVKAFPEQRFVLDHLAKPDIKSGIISPWKEALESLAAQPNAYCKLSGMVTEADWANWTPSDFTAYLNIAIEAFGAERLMFGSDWPVSNVSATYSEVYGLINSHINVLPILDQQMILGGTCAAFYQIS